MTIKRSETLTLSRYLPPDRINIGRLGSISGCSFEFRARKDSIELTIAPVVVVAKKYDLNDRKIERGKIFPPQNFLPSLWYAKTKVVRNWR